MGGLDAEALLAYVTIYWLAGTAGSAMGIYAEHERQRVDPVVGILVGAGHPRVAEQYVSESSARTVLRH
ncbi:hypothetical protein ABZ260_38575 [Streptosporangium sp. NPDC006013]|uniref:hypothetical protein n=1 Tax=Streptosporangium sp. NPDC006013 TaxID=3155596 RepID=UPI0033A5445E